MRPIMVEFQAFGPYKGHETVNFEHLAEHGLFLICGETGSGKTMLLDAMTFALYGMSSGNGRNSFEASRCLRADFDTSTFVRFIFEAGGDMYLFERRLDRKRKNLSPAYSMMKKDKTGNWQPLLENPKERDLNKKAVELIGLEYEQFRQVIILPQGQFEKLLVSNSDEKEKILTNIFGERMWNAVAEKFYEEASDRKDKLKLKKEKIHLALQEEDCETEEELELFLAAKRKEIADEQTAYDTAKYDEQREALNKDILLAHRFKDYHRIENNLADYMSKKGERKEWQISLNLALRAEKIRPQFDSLRDAQTEVKNQRNLCDSLSEIVASCDKSVKSSVEKIKLHNGRQSEIDELGITQTEMESHSLFYEGIDIATELWKSKKTAYEAKETLVCSENEELQKQNKKILKLKNEYEEAKTLHQTLLEGYISGISAELAEKLEDGKECPVCGSTHHPKKAAYSPENITRAQVDAAKHELDDKYNELQNNLSKLDEVKHRLDQAKEDLNQAGTELALANSNLEQMKSGMLEGISSMEELNASIEKIKDEIKKFADKKQALEQEETDNRAKLVEAKSKLSLSEDIYRESLEKQKKAQERLDASVIENGFEDSTQAKEALCSLEIQKDLQIRITQYDTSVAGLKEEIIHFKEELGESREPDEEQTSIKLKEVEEIINLHVSEKRVKEAECERLQKKLDMIKAEGEGISQAIKQAEEDVIFARKLRGDTGTGLQRYVLGIMFSSVVAAANKMLELVHDGRYRLFRSDEKNQGSNKRGLELKVYDKFSESSESRFVNTLSGGEKFLVSLALSIGMSAVAQKSGIRIEALFIDEGFGSLDEKSINDAMNVLDTVGEAHGMVGIISHVELLSERIATKLVVNKHEGVSSITTVIG